MPEIRSLHGIAQEQLLRFVGNRQLIVWGGNEACLETLASLRAHYRLRGQVILLTMQAVGFERFGKDTVFANPNTYWQTHGLDADTHCVIVASQSFRQQIVTFLTGHGLAADRDFISHHALFRPKLFVRLASQDKSVVASRDIAAFIVKHEQALAGATIEIAGFPDPMATNGIRNLLDSLSPIAPLTISTYVPPLGLVTERIAYRPRIRLFVFACERDFRCQFPGFVWPSLEQEVIPFLERAPEDMVIEVIKIGFNDTKTDFPQRKNIIYANHQAYPWDYSPVLRYATNPTTEDREALAACCGFDLDAALAKARRQSEKNCMCERVFPVFNGDGSLAICHLYTEGVLTQSPQAETLAQIIAARSTNPLCGACQQRGLHRLDLRLLN